VIANMLHDWQCCFVRCGNPKNLETIKDLL
jgi:hypothetical protein